MNLVSKLGCKCVNVYRYFTVKMEMSREYLALEGEVQRWKQIAHDAQRESEVGLALFKRSFAV